MSIAVVPAGRFVEFARAELEAPIHRRFERLAELHATSIAAQEGPRVISYGELDRLADRIAQAILELRGPRQECAAILMDQGILVLGAILGCLKAGKIYAPLDSGVPAANLARLLRNADPGLIVTDRAHLSLAAEVSGGCPALCLDPAHLERFPARNPQLAISPGAPAYVYYTSGSTGEPKGVVDSHRNVMHNILRYTNGLRIGPEDRLTLLQMPGFSGAVSSMFGALLNGAALFPVNPRQESSASLAQWVRTNRLTMWHSVPSLFRQLCAAGGGFPSVRVIRLEGDQASPSDVELFRKHFGRHCVLVNGLGTTETGICRRYFVGWDTRVEGGLVPVGYEVEDVQVTVVSESGDPAPPGQTGEIEVRSDYLALGYWRRPDLTARAFRPGPDGSRVYRTGDLGRMRADGCLEHLGRLDGRVKIRGNWVEFAEVEGLLQHAPGVEQAVVSACTGTDGEKRLVGYFVAAPGETPTVTSLRRHLMERLPAHQVPTAFVAVRSLPLNRNGKIDRGALGPPSAGRPILETPYAPPRSEGELRLARLWRQVLELEAIGVDDDFFELGGDSLAAARVASALNIQVAALIEAPTIRRLGARLESVGERSAGDLVCFIRKAGERPPLFCVPGHGGELVGYRTLAALLPPDRPVVAFLAPPAARYSLPWLASRYVEELVRLQPDGPVLLSGYCFGGSVAYEMACQLRARGRRVDLLVLLGCFNDRWLAGQPLPKRAWVRTALFARRAAYHLAKAVSLGPRAGWGHLTGKLRARRSHASEAHRQREFERLAETGGALPPELSKPGLANRAAVRDWIPGAYDGRVLLLGGSEPRGGHYGAPLMGWGGVLEGEVACEFFPDELKGPLAEPAVHLVARRLAREMGD